MHRVNSAQAHAAAEVLDLDLEGLTEAQVTSAYRKASKTCHPDSGAYNPVRWAAISGAKATLGHWLQALERARPSTTGPKGTCRACGGAGFIQKRQGFYTGPRMMCVMCDGSGNPKKPDREE